MAFETFLEPNSTIELSTPFRDRVEKILVRDGDQVKAGQELAEIGAAVLKVQVKRAEEAASFHGQVDAAKNVVKMRSNQLKLLNELETTGNARPQELTMARTELAVAKAELLSAEETRLLRKIELQVAKRQLAEKIVTSPIDGVVVKVYKQEAELVGGGDTEPLMTLAQLDPLRAVFYLPPKAGLQLKPGQQFQLQVGGRIVEATSAYVAPVINPQSGTIEVRLEVPNPDGDLIAGSRCILDIPGE